jgi:hypothetical protein
LSLNGPSNIVGNGKNTRRSWASVGHQKSISLALLWGCVPILAWAGCRLSTQ